MAEKFRLLSKRSNEIVLGFDEPHDLRVGDCVKIFGGGSASGSRNECGARGERRECSELEVIAQVYDLQYGGFAKTVSKLFVKMRGQDAALANELVARNKKVFSEFCVAKCKVRGTLRNGLFTPGLMELPATNAAVERLQEKQVLKMIDLNPKIASRIGVLHGSSEPLEIDLAGLQGVTLITGRKGSGKSHLAKKLLEDVIANGAPAIVLDVNGEYANLRFSRDGSESGFARKIIELVPGKNFFIPLDGISFETFARMCQIEENHNAFRLFARYWTETEKGKNLKDLREWVEASRSPLGTINAAVARLDYAASLGVFGDYDFGRELAKIRAGGAVVLNLFKQGEKNKELSIVYVLRQLIAAGLRDEGRIFLFAEEAQNYFEKEFWSDVITRMRHLGIYSVVITNEPTTLPSMVFRQCDNLFAFSFSADNDLAFVANAQVIDPESLSLLKNLGVGQCVAIGKCTNGFPLLAQVGETTAKAGGETKVLWKQDG